MASQIQEFYENQNIFITGGTGFLGKVLLEKLLRSTNCRRIYLLIREKKGKSMQDRLDQLLNDVLFDRLKTERPDYKDRILCIGGDCCLENLGIKNADELILLRTINIVFHVAATVRFNEHLKLAYQINVRSTSDIVKLCKRMQQLKSFVHVSTAYSHCYRKEIDECFYNSPRNYKEIGDLLGKLSDDAIEKSTVEILNKWPNTYTFTKALAEDVIENEANSNLPVGIFRPTIVIATYKEPVPGWVDNLNGTTGSIAAAITGILRTALINEDDIGDVIPVDYCTSALIATAWDVATKSRTTIPIYNYVSSVDNPIRWGEFVCLNRLYVAKYPTKKMLWVPIYKPTQNFHLYQFLKLILHIFPAIIFDFISMLCLKKPKILKTYQYIHQSNLVQLYFLFKSWHFTNNNIKQLLSKLNRQDSEIFQFNIDDISWTTLCDSYVKGVRIYLIKDPLVTLDDAKRKLWWLQNAHKLLMFILNILIFLIIYYLFVRIFN